jgi:hypothetical protein
MSADGLQSLSKELDKLKTAGHTAVAIDPLINYVGGLLSSARLADPESERQRIALNFEGQLEAYRAEINAGLEMFKAVLETGQSALRALSVVNGAAAVAVLAFLGNVLSRPSEIALGALPLMSAAMTSFALGVGFAALGFATRYFSQASFGGDFFDDKERGLTWGRRWRMVAIGAGITSLVLFFAGIATAWAAVQATLLQP